ncbi:unnamed protein product [Schistosoma curassoni]|uniref:Uncharacterized protein n=1 Tax=Schistosoma curassoni TaxID=6186 RepID=A0A183JW64_9TREM|nr:unnamed protein product [Schistosoma curassoni]
MRDKRARYICILSPPYRFFMYSGNVNTPLAIYTGRNTHPRS